MQRARAWLRSVIPPSIQYEHRVGPPLKLVRHRHYLSEMPVSAETVENPRKEGHTFPCSLHDQRKDADLASDPQQLKEGQVVPLLTP